SYLGRVASTSIFSKQYDYRRDLHSFPTRRSSDLNLEQHHEMKKELKRLARREDMVLPAEMKEEHQNLLTELKRTDRSQFDRTYSRIMSEIAQQDREMFSRMATEGESEEIRAFAATQLGTFDTHKTQLETVDAELLRTY